MWGRCWLTLVFWAVLGGCAEETHHAPPPACTPNCQGRTCGSDGCGGTCGSCLLGETCTLAGACTSVCLADCTGRQCGDDGCGGSCGTCQAPNPFCAPTNRCVDCLPNCEGRQCGDDGCGGSCGACTTPFVCTATVGTCRCVGSCVGRECGDNGCGASCGGCDVGEICNATGTCEICTPNCTGRECGDDGCGGTCGAGCGNGEICNAAGQCVNCTPSCGDNECGDDGCGGSCGTCLSNVGATLSCTASGICRCPLEACVPDCTGQACGDDGCGGSCGECKGGQVCAYDRTTNPLWQCAAYAGPDPSATFFVTSRATWLSGGNFGGLAGADAICQQRATEVGLGGKTWRAYLSVAGTPARGRIGNGPWRNVRGQTIVSAGCGANCLTELHQNGVRAELALTELGTQVDWRNEHDLYTGSDGDGQPNGLDCAGWTSAEETTLAQVGHVDGVRPPNPSSWNSAHTTGCDAVAIACTAGRGLLYCFSP